MKIHMQHPRKHKKKKTIVLYRRISPSQPLDKDTTQSMKQEPRLFCFIYEDQNTH